jgi:hypothetical protein
MTTYRLQVWFRPCPSERRFHRWLTLWAGRELARAQQYLYCNQKAYPRDIWRVTVN